MSGRYNDARLTSIFGALAFGQAAMVEAISEMVKAQLGALSNTDHDVVPHLEATIELLSKVSASMSAMHVIMAAAVDGDDAG